MSPSEPAPPRIVFLCYGNACRSQMAEAYGRTLGEGILVSASAGLNPLGYIPDEVATVMEEDGVTLEGQWSKSLEQVYAGGVDLIVDLVGGRLPNLANTPVRRRPVKDPFGRRLDDYRATRDIVRLEVEALVQELRDPLADR